ncbi:MAG TPA: HAMP domain-containing sensor histidine kinase [Rubrobacteraceae bacterium]|nr:HAMP domain-containing sensor histidine kinase [Rubrobacteraceae bacterium]
MPIRWRLTIFNALAIGLILLFLGLALFLLLRNALFANIEETVRGEAVAAARSVEAGDGLGEAGRLAPNEVYLMVRDKRGQILDLTDNFPDNGKISDRVWRRALESGKPVYGKAEISHEEGADYVYAVPVKPKTGTARVVEAGKSSREVENTLEVFDALLIIVIGAAFLVSLVGAYLLARAALRPVETVVGSAREITESDLAKRLPVSNPRDEIGRLAVTINALLSRLEAAFARREEALSRQRRFAADASHELRTPLTSISGYARMLDEWGLEDPTVARESITAIRNETDRLRALAESLLALTRGDEGPPMRVEPADLATVAAEAAETARTIVGDRLKVEYDQPDGPVEATFDRNRVRQVAAILLDNAIKYTPDGGRVTVAARERGGWAELVVSDTGIGIPEEQLPLIFERFHRVDAARAGQGPSAGGAGLGLSIARQIAEAHGGTIEAESQPGKGSIFTLKIPGNWRRIRPEAESAV